MKRFAIILAALAAFVSAAVAQPAPAGSGARLPPMSLGGVMMPSGGAQNTQYSTSDKTTYPWIDDPFIALNPANGVRLCVIMACDKFPLVQGGHRNSLAIVSPTQGDPGTEDNLVYLGQIVDKKYAPAWQPNTMYPVGYAVSYARNVGNAVYVVIEAGTSASSGPGPVGAGAGPTVQNKSQDITDGTVRWRYSGSNALNANANIYSELLILDGAGPTWGQATNLRIRPSATPSPFVVGHECDLTNESGVDSVNNGVAYSCFYTVLDGPNRSTQHFAATSRNADTFGARWGFRTAGTKVAEDAEFEAGGRAAVGFGVNTFNVNPFGNGQTHSTAGFQNNSETPRGFYNTGPASGGGFVDASLGSQSAFVSSGTKNGPQINLIATSPTAIRIGGTIDVGIDLTAASVANYQILGTGFSVSPAGAITGRNLVANGSATNGLDLSGGTFSSWQILGKGGFSVAPGGSVNGATLNTTGGATLSDFLKLPATTVASLPTCNAATQDRFRSVSDANAPSSGVAVVGGGGVRRPVFCDGTTGWVSLY